MGHRIFARRLPVDSLSVTSSFSTFFFYLPSYLCSSHLSSYQLGFIFQYVLNGFFFATKFLLPSERKLHLASFVRSSKIFCVPLLANFHVNCVCLYWNFNCFTSYPMKSWICRVSFAVTRKRQLACRWSKRDPKCYEEYSCKYINLFTLIIPLYRREFLQTITYYYYLYKGRIYSYNQKPTLPYSHFCLTDSIFSFKPRFVHSHIFLDSIAIQHSLINCNFIITM